MLLENHIRIWLSICIAKMGYTCDRCNYETEHACNFKKHLNRKTPCVVSNIDILPSDIYKQYFEKNDEEDRVYACEFCEKSFKYRQNKYAHQKICKKRADVVASTDDANEIVVMKNEIELLKKTIEEMKTTTTNNVNIANNNSNNNNNTINIHVNGFGKENIDYITDSPNYKNFMLSCIKKQVDGVCNMLVQKHFHDKHPENHNIKKLNKKDKFIDCYDGRKWNPKLIDSVLDEIFIRMELDFAKFLESIRDERGLISRSAMDGFMRKVGAPLNWDLSYGNYSFDDEIDDSKKESLKNDLYMLACEYIYRRSKEI